VDVSVYATREDQQAARVELLLPGHLTANLGYPAVPHPDVGDLAVARGDDGPAANDKLKMRNSHAGILA
jgi:hypothetical protein